MAKVYGLKNIIECMLKQHKEYIICLKKEEDSRKGKMKGGNRRGR